MTNLWFGVVVVLVAAGVPARAKCPLIFIELEAEVVGGAVQEHDRVLVEVEPDPNTTRDGIDKEANRFRIRVPFDTTKSGGRLHHDCSRRPVTVTVQLMTGDREVDRATLNVETAFEEGDQGDFTARSRVLLEKPSEESVSFTHDAR